MLMLLLTLSVSLAAGPEKEPPPPDVQSLVMAERAFARASVAEGIREAFLAYLAPDAVIFRPGPVPGRDWFEAQPPVPGRLSWEPLFADVARSGDFGYTTGPWQYLPPGTAGTTPEPAYGHYISVWQRDPEDGWRVIVDFGNSYPQPETSLGDLSYPSQRSGSGNRRAGSERQPDPEATLREADRLFAVKAAEAGAAAACEELAGDAVRVYRAGATPLAGKAKACAALAAGSERSASQPLGSVIARSGDLGYVYGNLEFLPGEGEVAGTAAGPGSFLRIWKREKEGEWRLALDVSVPHPAAP